jgi:hypothetical protein
MMRKTDDTNTRHAQDDSDADAFSVLSLLVILAAGGVYYLNH